MGWKDKIVEPASGGWRAKIVGGESSQKEVMGPPSPPAEDTRALGEKLQDPELWKKFLHASPGTVEGMPPLVIPAANAPKMLLKASEVLNKTALRRAMVNFAQGAESAREQGDSVILGGLKAAATGGIAEVLGNGAKLSNWAGREATGLTKAEAKAYTDNPFQTLRRAKEIKDASGVGDKTGARLGEKLKTMIQGDRVAGREGALQRIQSGEVDPLLSQKNLELAPKTLEIDPSTARGTAYEQEMNRILAAQGYTGKKTIQVPVEALPSDSTEEALSKFHQLESARGSKVYVQGRESPIMPESDNIDFLKKMESMSSVQPENPTAYNTYMSGHINPPPGAEIQEVQIGAPLPNKITITGTQSERMRKMAQEAANFSGNGQRVVTAAENEAAKLNASRAADLSRGQEAVAPKTAALNQEASGHIGKMDQVRKMPKLIDLLTPSESQGTYGKRELRSWLDRYAGTELEKMATQAAAGAKLIPEAKASGLSNLPRNKVGAIQKLIDSVAESSRFGTKALKASESAILKESPNWHPSKGAWNIVPEKSTGLINAIYGPGRGSKEKR